MYIARTKAFFEGDDENLFIPDYWTYSEDTDDEDFAGDVYLLNEEGERILNWWLRCRRMNLYQRNHSFNVDNRTAKEIWDELMKYSRKIIQK